MKKHAVLIALGLLLALLFVGNAAHFYRLSFVDRLSAVLYDYQLRLTMPRMLDERIVILDINEKSLQEEGRWPWSRDRLAVLMDQLFNHYGIVQVGFDVVFAEPDNSSGLQVLEGLAAAQLKTDSAYQAVFNQLKPQLEYDNLFAEKIKNRQVVLGYYFTSQQDKYLSGALPAPVLTQGALRSKPTGMSLWNGYGANLPQLQAAAMRAGHFNPRIDTDGVVRRVPMLVEYEGAYYASLSLAMVQSLLGDAPVKLGFAEGKNQDYAGLEWLELGDGAQSLKIPVDQEVAALIPYRGKQGSFRYVSIADVLHGRVDVAQLKNKIVLVGTTAPGLMDMRSTPVSEVYAGVEIHANMIAGMLDQNLKQQPAYMLGAEVLWLILLGLSLSVLLPWLSPVRAILVAIAAFALSLGLGMVAWQYGDLVMPIANSLVMIAVIFALNMSFGYLVESRTKRQITNLFGQYVPSELVDEMSKNPASVSMLGESREMSILFSDVRGFTSISEGLEPQELSLLMNEFLSPLSRVVYKHRGTIDKYMGDCIMAFWGAPLSDAQHARNAITAGLEMQAKLDELRPQFIARGWPEIKVGVGVNTGQVSVGNMGSDVRVAYTVMGDEVNLASRLEGITKQYGVGFIVGENTRHAASEFVYRELDHVRVKGKDKPIAIYEPLGLVGEVSEEILAELKIFQEMRRCYRKQDWDQTELQLMNLQRLSAQTELYKIYAQRVAHFRKQPPDIAWDGVYVFESK
ncbi:MAG: adenylate/guanylate cyclase domain-containing protein [Sideroxydans sp.]|nr:adenylate/guanylate cyclase domain-containing protein [Sideroxydans sp.]